MTGTAYRRNPFEANGAKVAANGTTGPLTARGETYPPPRHLR